MREGTGTSDVPSKENVKVIELKIIPSHSHRWIEGEKAEALNQTT